MSYEEATQSLVSAGRPLTLCFLPMSLYITAHAEDYESSKTAGNLTAVENSGLTQRRDGKRSINSLDPQERAALNAVRTLQRGTLGKRAMEKPGKAGWGPWGWRLMLAQITLIVIVSMAFALYPRLKEMAGRATLL